MVGTPLSFSRHICMYVELPGANPTIVSYSAGAVKIYSATCSQVSFENKFFSSTLKNALSYYNVGCSCNLEVEGKAPGVNVMIIFLRFSTIFCEKIVFNLQNNVTETLYCQNCQLYPFFRRFLKNHNIGPHVNRRTFPPRNYIFVPTEGPEYSTVLKTPSPYFYFCKFSEKCTFSSLYLSDPLFSSQRITYF
jgi:hypothetical protein